MREICEHIVQSEYYSQDVYGRTVDSMLIEWVFHNNMYHGLSNVFLFPFGKVEEIIGRAKHVDFDRNAEGRNYQDHILAGIGIGR